MTGMKPAKWFQARLKWAVLKQGRGLHHWRESEYIFLSTDRETAFQEALGMGYAGECWLNPTPEWRNGPRFRCRFAEVEYLEELGTDRTSFQAYLGEKPGRQAIGFDHDFNPAACMPDPVF